MEAWIRSLVECQFFGSCVDHEGEVEITKNLFCIDCCCSLCRHCRDSHHAQHRCLRIYRFRFRDVIRCREFLDAVSCEDFKNDCSKIETHTSNNNLVFYIAPNPVIRMRSTRDSIKLKCCNGCWRYLRSSCFSYCSLACKISSVNGDSGDDNLSKGDGSGPDSESDKGSSAEANPVGSSSSEQKQRSCNMNKRKGIPVRAPCRLMHNYN